LAILTPTRLPERLAAQGPNNSGALFLEFPVGARAVGMGRAALADGGTGEAAFWNPAGLAEMPAATFELHTVALPAGRTHAVTAYFPNSRIGVFGAAIYLVDYGDLERTDSSNTTIARISPRNLELLASLATTLPGPVTLGVNYKLVTFQVNCSGDCLGLPAGEGVTHAVDVGGQFFISATDLTIGVALRNLGFRLQVENRDQADPLPTSFGLGALWRRSLGAADAEHRFDLRVAADVDRPWSSDGTPAMRVGVDVGYRAVARVRAGYSVESDRASSASVGLGVTSGSIGVDLAQTFLSDSELEADNPTFFSFRISF
jgi:hypothetical protein